MSETTESLDTPAVDTALIDNSFVDTAFVDNSSVDNSSVDTANDAGDPRQRGTPFIPACYLIRNMGRPRTDRAEGFRA